MWMRSSGVDISSLTYRSRAGHTFVSDATSPPLASILCWFPVLDVGVAGLFYKYISAANRCSNNYLKFWDLVSISSSVSGGNSDGAVEVGLFYCWWFLE